MLDVEMVQALNRWGMQGLSGAPRGQKSTADGMGDDDNWRREWGDKMVRAFPPSAKMHIPTLGQ